ncbi:MAG: hypothetical protein ABI586_07280 [Candidatus Nanopelagicales bacterium]
MSSIDPHPSAETTTVHSAAPTAARAQILATEHWSLLATRGMTWSEVMSRISIHLTIVSASLVVLALVTQASGFGTAFKVLSIGLAATILILGTLTAVRVHNASIDDAAMIIGMNRLRAAYVEMEPDLSRYFVTSWNDDVEGLMKTYTMGNSRHMFSHIVGSTTMFMTITNTIIAGTLGALIADAANAGATATVVVGCLAGLAYFATMMEVGRRSFGKQRAETHFPSTNA